MKDTDEEWGGKKDPKGKKTTKRKMITSQGLCC
jgi:hypothetical protein